MLGFCCFCLPLQIGCIIIGVFYIIVAALRLYMVLVLGSLIHNREDGQTEEIEVGEFFYFLVVYHSVQLFTGILVLIGSFALWPRVLKLCACVSGILGTVALGIVFVDSDKSGVRDYLSACLIFLLLMYLTFVLWSFTRELSDPLGPPIMFISTGPFAYDPRQSSARQSYVARQSLRNSLTASQTVNQPVSQTVSQMAARAV